MQSSRAIPVEVQILAWLPATAASLLVVVRFCYAMFQSQTRRVNRALVGASGNMAEELGFMRKVKDEVHNCWWQDSTSIFCTRYILFRADSM